MKKIAGGLAAVATLIVFTMGLYAPWVFGPPLTPATPKGKYSYQLTAPISPLLSSIAFDVNKNNKAVGHYTKSPLASQQMASEWDAKGPVRPLFKTPNVSSMAVGINDSGQIVGTERLGTADVTFCVSKVGGTWKKANIRNTFGGTDT
ncbi:MAG: hypothetical protein GY869_29150, partial [Planctomycetes bacterium]|nr:hypothetical protein [Planctomycetota bacterium]